MRARVRLTIWILLAGAIPLVTLGWMLAVRGSLVLNNDPLLIGGWLFITVLLGCVGLLLRTTPPDAIRLSHVSSLWLILGTAALLHAAALLLLWPGLSEDVLRYRSDGRMSLAGMSPYSTTPREFFAMHPPDSIDVAMPFQQMCTIYPPTSQVIFIVAAALENRLTHPPVRPTGTWREILPDLTLVQRALVLRTIFASFSVASAWLLVRLLIDMNRSPWWAILFAWNPLVIVETAGMGHQDIVGVFLLLYVLWAMHRQRFGAAAAMLALAVGVKLIAIVLLPFLCRDARGLDTRSASLRVLLTFAACAIAIFAPLMLYQHGYRGWLESTRIFSTQWEANGSTYELIKSLFGHGDGSWAMERAKFAARLLGAAMLLLSGVLLWRKRARFEEAAYWLFLVLLLFSPVVYPWYLLWVLCFVPLLCGAQGWTGLVFGGAVVATYLLWHLPQWVMPGRILVMEYAPVYAVLLFELIAALTTRGRQRADHFTS
jgi:hypothetical protein